MVQLSLYYITCVAAFHWSFTRNEVANRLVSSLRAGYRMTRWGIRLLVVHALFWIVLAVAAYTTAGPYRFASCWVVIPTYLPPVAVLFAAIAICSLVVLLVSVIRPEIRRGWEFAGATHGMTITVGLLACNRAAYLAAGQVNCL